MRQRLAGRPLQRELLKQAKRLGWRVAHFPSVKTEQGWRTGVAGDAKGFPDMLLVRDRVLAIEVKGDGDGLRPDQIEWLAAFRLAGCEAVVVTPAMWFSGEVDEILERRGPSPPQEIHVQQEPLAADLMRR